MNSLEDVKSMLVLFALIVIILIINLIINWNKKDYYDE